MKFPKPPWYEPLNNRLEGSEPLVNALLILIIVVSLYLLLTKQHLLKTAWLVYLISP